MNDFTISDSASSRIVEIIASEPDPKNTKLRISVEGGGCSGFQYKYDLTTETPKDDDFVFHNGGAIVIIDEISLSLLKGSTINYIIRLGEEYFEIKNPNASSGCGCGNSFAV